jgi:hypothetical protein
MDEGTGTSLTDASGNPLRGRVATLGAVSGAAWVARPDPEKARSIATRLGTKPSWEAIRVYYEDALVPGLTRDQVYELLDKIGPYDIDYYEDPNDPQKKGAWCGDYEQRCFSENIVFRDDDVHWGLANDRTKFSGWYLVFSAEGQLMYKQLFLEDLP